MQTEANVFRHAHIHYVSNLSFTFSNMTYLSSLSVFIEWVFCHHGSGGFGSMVDVSAIP